MDNYQPQNDLSLKHTDQRRFIVSLYLSFILILPIILAYLFSDSLPFLTGIYPLKTEGIAGIFTSPLVHADHVHLAGNVSALFVLFMVLFNNYSPMAWMVLLLSYVVPGAWTWLFARPAWHVGASGMVYALASFIFFTGIMHSRTKLVAMALFVVFMYGSIFWGIFPLIPEVSWEGHLSGFVLGLLMAFAFRKDLKTMYPVKPYFEQEEDDETDVSEDAESLEDDNDKSLINK